MLSKRRYYGAFLGALFLLIPIPYITGVDEVLPKAQTVYDILKNKEGALVLDFGQILALPLTNN